MAISRHSGVEVMISSASLQCTVMVHPAPVVLSKFLSYEEGFCFKRHTHRMVGPCGGLAMKVPKKPERICCRSRFSSLIYLLQELIIPWGTGNKPLLETPFRKGGLNTVFLVKCQNASAGKWKLWSSCTPHGQGSTLANVILAVAISGWIHPLTYSITDSDHSHVALSRRWMGDPLWWQVCSGINTTLHPMNWQKDVSETYTWQTASRGVNYMPKLGENSERCDSAEILMYCMYWGDSNQ